MECRQVEPPKKIWQPPLHQKQAVNASSLNQLRTNGSIIRGNKPSSTSVDSVAETNHASTRHGSRSSWKTSRDPKLKSGSSILTKNSRNGDETSENVAPAEQAGHVHSDNCEADSRILSAASFTPENKLSKSANVDVNSEATSPAFTLSGNRRLSDVNEPTKQPVADRLAAWKKKVADVENVPTSSQTSALRDKLQTIQEDRYGHKHMAASRADEADAMSPEAAVFTGKDSKTVSGIGSNCLQGSGKVSFPPLKEGEVRQRTLPRAKAAPQQASAQPSWKKLGPATFEIQQKLTAMCENWKRNEIAEKSRKERSDDLSVLENRWKNGILCEEQQDQAVASALCKPSATESEIISSTKVFAQFRVGGRFFFEKKLNFCSC